MEFSIKMEIMALIVLFILFLYHSDRQASNNRRYWLYTACLMFAAATIIFDIISAVTLSLGTGVPDWIHFYLNTIYFLVLYIMCNLIAWYIFYIMFEHAMDKHCYYLASKILAGITCGLIVFVLLNVHTKWLFTVENGVYVRGRFNGIGYVMLGAEVVMLCMCYFRNRNIVSFAMKRLMQTIPTLVVIVMTLQYMMPNLILTGSLAALVCMILYINFQSTRNGRDFLTGLPGRTVFTHEIHARKLRNEKVHMIAVHLNRFEEINKRYGVRTGDYLLFAVAGYLEKKFKGYQISRFGNTLFVLMAKAGTPEENQRQAEEVKRRFEAPWSLSDNGIYLCTNVVHQVIDLSRYDENQAINRLEYAMNVARETGSKDLVFFNEDMELKYSRQEYVLEQIKTAIRKQSFEMYYQPLYNCNCNKIDSAESLIRLRDSEGAYISPAEFIPLAEKHGLLEQITWQVLELVCEFLAEHEDVDIDHISVNIPAGQLTDPNLEQNLLDTCRKYAIRPERLRLEITERGMASNPHRVRVVMKRLSEKGLRFYLDDFGIGYSNLAMVLQLPFETVKLDASLLVKIREGELESRTIGLLVEMLHNSGFQVVAEGIETLEEMQAVRILNVDHIQGYYYAKPMSEIELVEFMSGGKVR